jgi:outer membrane protein assembly factor BamB
VRSIRVTGVRTLLTSLCGVFLLMLPTKAAVASPPQVLRFADGGNDVADSMATDAAGNLYIAAELDQFTSPSRPFAVIKYNALGQRQWIFRFSQQLSGAARAVQVDAQGNVYAAGVISTFDAAGSLSTGGVVVSLNPAGQQRWAQPFNGQADTLALDGSGNVYVGGNVATGSAGTLWSLAKYTTAGQLLWRRQHSGTLNPNVEFASNRVTALAMDPQKNLIALGSTANAGAAFNLTDMTVVKYDPQGNRLWARDFVDRSTNAVLPTALAVDRSGSVYATGNQENPEIPRFPLTIKYDKNGKFLFELKGDGAGGASVAVDATGHIVLAGNIFPAGANPVAQVAKIDATGHRLWLTRLPANKGNLFPGKVLIDAKGNVYAAGTIFNFGGSSQADFLISKLSANGVALGQFRFTPANVVTHGSKVNDAVLDPFGNLLVTGIAINATFNFDIYTLRIPPDFAFP